MHSDALRASSPDKPWTPLRICSSGLMQGRIRSSESKGKHPGESPSWENSCLENSPPLCGHCKGAQTSGQWFKREKSEISSVQVKLSQLLCTVTFVPCIFWMDKFLIKVQKWGAVSSRASADILPALLSEQLLQPPPCSISHHIHGCSTFPSSRWYNSCIYKPSAFQSRFFSLIATTQLQSVIFPTHIFNTPSKS